MFVQCTSQTLIGIDLFYPIKAVGYCTKIYETAIQHLGKYLGGNYPLSHYEGVIIGEGQGGNYPIIELCC